MRNVRMLVIGGGIGGLTCAIALCNRGFEVELIERDPSWSVYGVGIIQQSNVIRAMASLGIVDDYLNAGFGFDHVDIYAPNDIHVATVPSPKLVPGYPANVGIGRRALHAVLGARAREVGSLIRLGVTARGLEDDGRAVQVTFSDGTRNAYDLVVGADGLYSTTRTMILPDAPTPEFTGQGVWRHNFERPEEITSLRAYEGHMGMGLVPLSATLMYLFVTTAEPGNPRYGPNGLAEAMRGKLASAPLSIRRYAEQIRSDSEVVFKPLEWIFLTGDWHKGRVALLGDAVHATTPHLGQGAGMAIEDALVLAEELACADEPEAAFAAYRRRRIDRCRYIVEKSKAICDGQLGKGPPVDQASATREMFQVMSAPI